MDYARLFMMRIAALPVSAVDPLRCEDGVGWADEVLERESALRARGSQISNLLHDLVRDNDDESLRRRLLALRRQVFGNTLPRDPAAMVTLVAASDPQAAAVLAGWIEDRHALDELRESGAAVVGSDVARSRGELRRLAEEQRLLLGL